jgi:hypothetical protein
MTTTTDINHATLAVLSITAAQLWEEIDNCEDELELQELLHEQLNVQQATEAKVDAIAYITDHLKLDLETWEARLEKIVELHSMVIQRRRNQIAQIKGYLLKLHSAGVLSEQVAGVERRIDFQNNPPSVVLLVEPDELPTEFQEVKVSAKAKDILAAHKRGEDVSAMARSARHRRSQR